MPVSPNQRTLLACEINGEPATHVSCFPTLDRPVRFGVEILEHTGTITFADNRPRLLD